MRELKIVIKNKGQILLPSGRNRKKKRPAETKPQLIFIKNCLVAAVSFFTSFCKQSCLTDPMVIQVLINPSQ